LSCESGGSIDVHARLCIANIGAATSGSRRKAAMLSTICDRTSSLHDCASGCGRTRSVLSIRIRAGGLTASTSATSHHAANTFAARARTSGVPYDKGEVVVAGGRTVHMGGNQYRRVSG
jgi:hypothetical protein